MYDQLSFRKLYPEHSYTNVNKHIVVLFAINETFLKLTVEFIENIIHKYSLLNSKALL